MKYLKKEHMLIISIKLLFAFTTGFVGGCVFRTIGVPHSLTMPIGYIFGFILCGYLK
jgi:hypothetical protein